MVADSTGASCMADSAPTPSRPRVSIVIPTFNDLSAQAPRIDSYELCRCSNCGLEFSSPMKSGSNEFYEWVCTAQDYYPTVRWEWTPLLEFMTAEGVKTHLDVGCGSGQFLHETRNLPIRSIGIDLNPESVKACTEKGLQAR